uniref:Uncharacterized protein n=1 Tax=Anguilla anguilla TaxID=7936 RepID=A0A0E9QC81_ANGAN
MKSRTQIMISRTRSWNICSLTARRPLPFSD